MVLDTQRHELQVVNAGHSPPLLRDGKTRKVRLIASEEAEIPLGINADVRYPQVSMHLEPGSLVLFYTDGVNEAMNQNEETYGNERVRAVLAHAGDDAVHVGRALVADVRRFAGGRRQSDDICVIAFGRAGAH
jgi:serine phosphatase RsbU (regulator of sigma subunit)